MPKTTKDFMQELADADLTVTAWASQHGFARDICYSVLNGRSKLMRGAARKCARAMGLLPEPASKKATPSKRSSAAEATQ